jgi:hypothetical protein
MAAGAEATPRSTSPDYDAMAEFWAMVDAINKGAPGLRSSKYLPKFPKEPDDVYDLRRKTAPLTNVYADISRNLGSKPFAKPVEVSEGAPDVVAGKIDPETKHRSGGLIDDIDGLGNSLHVFASRCFKSGIDKGIDWILVDHTKLTPRADGQTLSAADEAEQGARPYWVHIPADRMLAVFSDFVAGVEMIVHARIYEPAIEREGYGTVLKERVRVLERVKTAQGYGAATWSLFEKKTDAQGKETWEKLDAGDYTIGVIPLVPFIPSKRHGTSYVVDPPLRDLAYMQVEEFQQESNLKEIAVMTAFPMLAAIGMDPPTGGGSAFMTGPRTLLTVPFSPEGTAGDFKYVEPQATSLTFLEERLKNFRQEMRDLGMQPLQAANLTVITTANASQKASSAVQAWAILFKDALDQALSLTCKWLKITEAVTAKVHTDFAVEISGDLDMADLLAARTAGQISRETFWSELQRRGKLGPDFDHEEEEKRVKEEASKDRATKQEDLKFAASLAPNKIPA